MSEPDLLNDFAALGAAQAGAYVVPVDWNTGEPLCEGLYQGASRSKAQIEHWYAKHDGLVSFEVVAKNDDEAELLGIKIVPFNARTLDLESKVEAEYENQKARELAARRLAGENYSGGYRELTLEELLESSVAWLVDSLIAVDSVNFLVAKKNTGKTFLYLDLVYSMVTGRDFLGKVTRPGKVMIVLGEGQAGFGERMLAWSKAHGEDLAAITAGRVKVVTGANLNNDASLALIRADAEAFKPDLVIIDTWAAVSGIREENDNGLGNATINNAKEALPGAALLFAAHPPHSAADSTAPRMRGASSPSDTADVVMTLWRDEKYSKETGIEREYLGLSTEDQHAGKNRNAVRETLRGLYLEGVELGLDPKGRMRNSAVLRQDDAAAYSPADLWALKHMKPGVEYTTEELAKDTGTHRNTIGKYAKTSRFIETVKRRGKPNTYMLAADAPDPAAPASPQRGDKVGKVTRVPSAA